MKHGDIYTTKDGRELMVVCSADISYRPHNSPPCEFVGGCKYNEEFQWPCKGGTIIFVKRRSTSHTNY